MNDLGKTSHVKGTPIKITPVSTVFHKKEPQKSQEFKFFFNRGTTEESLSITNVNNENEGEITWEYRVGSTVFDKKTKTIYSYGPVGNSVYPKGHGDYNNHIKILKDGFKSFIDDPANWWDIAHPNNLVEAKYLFDDLVSYMKELTPEKRKTIEDVIKYLGKQYNK